VHVEPSHWSHEIFISKTVVHHIWPRLMAGLELSPLLLFILLIRWGCLLMLFQQVRNASFASRWLDTSFHAWATWTLEQIDVETCKVSIMAWHQFWPVKNRALWNMNLKTYHPLKHVKFQRATQHAFYCLNSPSLQNMSPLKCVKFWELCFIPMCHLPCSPMWSPSMPHDPSMMF
jgi:hypothetical protein